MQYILAAHGKYAVETKKSCEMITGVQDGIHTVVFTEGMGIEEVKSQYETIIKKYLNDDIAIIVDIIGGTPCNAAIHISAKYPNITIISGLSLALLIPICLGETVDQAIDGVKDVIKVINTEDEIRENEYGEEEN
jgi:PTS system mannose-specific IIA component